jgi:Flp pilus assembly protein TadG
MEFAFVVLVLFTFIFGIIDFARALFAYHFVANAAREGTRYASVRGLGCTTSTIIMTDCPATQANIKTHLQTQATGIGMDPNQLNVNVNWPPQASSPSSCSSVQNNPGCTVQVTVSYPFKFILPLLPTSSVNMSSAAAAVITQ